MTGPRTRIWVVLAIGTASPAQVSEADATAYRSVTLHSTNEVEIRLIAKQRATPTERDFLGIEFHNKTGKPLAPPPVWIGADFEKSDLDTGRSRGSAGLFQVNISDLFPQSSGAKLPPGTTRRTTKLSDRAFVSLGMPPAAGWEIEGRVRVILADKIFDRVPFTFEWVRPDAAGLKTMRTRLRRLLLQGHQGRDASDASATFGALLAIEECSSQLAFTDCLAGLAAKREGRWGTIYVLSHLDHRFHEDSRLTTWILKRLQARDEHVIQDLMHMRQTWRPEFLPLAVGYHERGNVWVLNMLRLHGYPHASNPAISKRLSKPLLARLPFQSAAALDKLANQQRREAARRQIFAFYELGLTRDVDLLEVLEPWLDCKVSQFGARMPPGYSPGHDRHRVCDGALEAMLRILGDQPEKLFWDFRFETSTAKCDRMIADLRRRLAARKTRQRK